jgi:hypothetical protein
LTVIRGGKFEEWRQLDELPTSGAVAMSRTGDASAEATRRLKAL